MKLPKFITPNTKFTFILITVLWSLFGTSFSGNLQPHEVVNGAWLVPFYNLLGRLYASLFFSIPTSAVVLIIDKIIAGKIRIVLLTVATIGLFAFAYIGGKQAVEMEGLAYAGLALFALGILLPLTIFNYLNTKVIKE